MSQKREPRREILTPQEKEREGRLIPKPRGWGVSGESEILGLWIFASILPGTVICSISQNPLKGLMVVIVVIVLGGLLDMTVKRRRKRKWEQYIQEAVSESRHEKNNLFK